MPHAPGAGIFLLCDPCFGAYVGAAEERAVAALHFYRSGAGEKELAGKVGTEAAVFQPPLDDAALKDPALALYGEAELIGTSPADSCLLYLVGLAGATVEAAHCRQTSLAVAHGLYFLDLPPDTAECHAIGMDAYIYGFNDF